MIAATEPIQEKASMQAIPNRPAGPLLDPQVNAVIARLEQTTKRPSNGGPLGNSANSTTRLPMPITDSRSIPTRVT
jgi:hypothetical protein